jgi:hypothetical protein
MDIIKDLKARFPRLLPALAAVAVLGATGGFAAHRYLAPDCCYPGSPCCHPGSPCCHHSAPK